MLLAAAVEAVLSRAPVVAGERRGRRRAHRDDAARARRPGAIVVLDFSGQVVATITGEAGKENMPRTGEPVASFNAAPSAD